MVTVEVDSFFITHPELVGISATRNMGTKDEGNSRVATYGQEAQWLGGSYSQLGNLQGGSGSQLPFLWTIFLIHNPDISDMQCLFLLLSPE